MLAHQLMSAGVLLAAAALNSIGFVQGFDATQCDVYVFRTQENALWHCGATLPSEPDNQWTSLYCDHNQHPADGDYLFAWASDHPDDWCDFMIATVRQSADVYPLTEDVQFNETPGPNTWYLSALVDWGCYMTENGVTTQAYLVDSSAGKHAIDTTEQCTRTENYFDYWNLDASFRDSVQGWMGHVPDSDYTPVRQAWGRCHYDNMMVSPNYESNLGVQFAECTPGFVCEHKYLDYAACMPDPHADHECCVSWNNKCEKQGDCCLGSECNDNGYCEVGIEAKYDDPPGICGGRDIKEDKMLWNRCLDYIGGEQGDCAEGYICVGNSWIAQCEVDHSVKNDCCKYNYDDSNPRPGDCCVGWYSYCHMQNPEDGSCDYSQCLPGRETGVDVHGNSMLDVHDRVCTEVPHLASYNEVLGKCVGAVCGLWGDPHIITCDDLHYDCQAVGLFTVMKNHMFNIQGNFVFIDTPWGGASITNDLSIDYVKEAPNGVPTMQFSFPDFENIDQNNQIYDEKSRFIGPCPVYFYLDGEMMPIANVKAGGYLYGSATSDHSVKLTGYNQIDINHKVGEEDGKDVFSSSIIWIEGGGPFSEWSCIISYFICLPGEEKEQFEQDSVGLMGTPTGTTMDDWMGVDGQTLMIPDNNRVEASFNYCIENWCVDQEDSIMIYEEGLTFEDYKCSSQEYFEFDVNTCANTEEIIEACSEVAQQIACQMDKCAGAGPEVVVIIENIENITTNTGGGTDNILEFPNLEENDYGDCANLGAGLSASTGDGSWGTSFPAKASIFGGGGGYSLGYDNSMSVLVGGDFHCKSGAGFEGRGIFLGDMKLDLGGCERLAATAHGSLIHPFVNTACVEVGGDVVIDASFQQSKYIMYEYGNAQKSCHFVYKDNCQINGADCPTNMTALEEQRVFTNGDFKNNPDLDLSKWDVEIDVLKQKVNYWNSLDPNGVAEVIDGVLVFGAGVDNNPVQIFNIQPIETTITSLVFKKDMIGKTILIVVNNDGTFFVPPMCFYPLDHAAGQASICGVDTFPSDLTASILWAWPTNGGVEIVGSNELMGSVVIPKGDLTFSTIGQSGRMIVGGDFVLDGEFSELHNYEFDPVSKPLPLGEDEGEICEVLPPPPCNETYKILTSETACPSKPQGVVKMIKQSAESPEGEPMLYNIIIEPPKDINSAHTVKFSVDNPFANHTDIYIKHVKKVGKYALDPTCESMPFTPGCKHEAPIIEVGCHEYEGVEPFALVNLYFASNSDSFLKEISSGDVEIDKCCKPAEEYANGYGIVEYTFEIQCVCPETVTES